MKNLKLYGVDAPSFPLICFAITLGLIVGAFFIPNVIIKIIVIVIACMPAYSGYIFLHTSLIGKFRIWDKVINDLHIDPTSNILDLGCGRGAILTKLARKLTGHGTVTGIDIWQSRDQSGNSIKRTERNLATERVGDRVKLVTANMMDLPFEDKSFDLVSASFSIHNIHEKEGRHKALAEARRVLKDTGMIVIVDTAFLQDEYKEALTGLGFSKVSIEHFGRDGWWGNPSPMMSSYAVIGKLD